MENETVKEYALKSTEWLFRFIMAFSMLESIKTYINRILDSKILEDMAYFKYSFMEISKLTFPFIIFVLLFFRYTSVSQFFISKIEFPAGLMLLYLQGILFYGLSLTLEKTTLFLFFFFILCIIDSLALLNIRIQIFKDIYEKQTTEDSLIGFLAFNSFLTGFSMGILWYVNYYITAMSVGFLFCFFEIIIYYLFYKYETNTKKLRSFDIKIPFK